MSSRLRNWGHLAANVLGLLAMLAMAEVLIYRHNLRLDLTPEQRYTLAPHSLRILDDLRHDVEVIAFVRREDPRNAFLRDLLWRANARQPRLTYRLVDINRNPALARKYNVDAYGAVMVQSSVRRKQFSNIREEILMAAIIQVTREYEKTVYHLTGHGERNFTDSDRTRGFSTAKAVLQQEFYNVKELSLLGDARVPPDASAIVIASPRNDLLPDELVKLREYLGKGGALLVMVDPGAAPSLIAFLRRYRIDLPQEIVADSEYRLAASEPLTFRVPDRADSRISGGLDADPVFSHARPIVAIAAKEDDGISIEPVLKTSKASWAIPSQGGEIPDDVQYRAGRDRAGVFDLGVEAVLPVEGRELPSEEPDDDKIVEEAMPRPSSRVIVFGDSDFASNFFIDLLGNRDLLVNSVNWLTLEDSLIGIRPARKARGREQFFVSSRQGYMAFLLGTIIQPAMFLGLGVAVFVWRRMR